MAEGVHGLHGLGLPVRDNVAFVLVQAEVRAYVEVEVVLVAFVAEQSVGLSEGVLVYPVLEARHLPLLGGESPGVKIEVERVMVHHVLLDPGDPPIGSHRLEAVEPGIFSPPPDAGGHDVGQNQAVDELREDEDFHVGQRHCGRLALQISHETTVLVVEIVRVCKQIWLPR